MKERIKILLLLILLSSFNPLSFGQKVFFDGPEGPKSGIKTKEMLFAWSEYVFTAKLESRDTSRLKIVNRANKFVSQIRRNNISEEVQILVDTLSTYLQYDIYKYASQSGSDISDTFHIDTIPFRQAYGVFIFNISDSIVELDAQDEQIFIIQEAKNMDGNWQPIEYWMYSGCGNSYTSKLLNPNEFGFLKIFRYEGDYQTLIRLKMHQGDDYIYSTPFYGNINKGQLDIPDFLIQMDEDIRANQLFQNKSIKTNR